MLPYLSIWAAVAVPSLYPVTLTRTFRAILLWGVSAFLILFIGLRHEVGGDWQSYLNIYNSIEHTDFWSAMVVSDPAYALLNLLAHQTGGGIYLVNTICAAIFVYGVTRLALDQHFAALAYCIALPYIVFVVGMGYTRQSAALGLLILALLALAKDRKWRFLLFTLAACTFHKSAVVILPLFFLVLERGKMRLFLFLLAAAPALYITLITAVLDKLVIYTDRPEYEAQGAAVRVAMNVMPALIVLYFRRRWQRYWGDARLWSAVSMMAIAVAFLLPFSSVVADRLSLYLSVLQVVALSRLPALVKNPLTTLYYGGVLAAYGALLYVWFSTSSYARCCWVPYQFMPFSIY